MNRRPRLQAIKYKRNYKLPYYFELDFQNEQSDEEESYEQSIYDRPCKLDVYPFTKKDSAKLFRTKGDKFALNEDEVYEQMKRSLLDLEKYGFDFRCISWKYETEQEGKRTYKKFNRKIYVKFECPECEQDSRPKTWSSILGNLEIRFQVQSLSEFWTENQEYRQKESDLNKMRYPSILKWMLKIYVEYCRDCGSAGEPFVYESQFKACQISFCKIVTNILKLIKPKKNMGNRQKLIEVHNHEEQLCEACQKGECYNIPKEAVYQIREGQV